MRGVDHRMHTRAVSKGRHKKKAHPAKARTPETASYALSTLWLSVETLIGPVAMMAVLFFALQRFADAGSVEAEAVLIAAVVAVRLPLLVYTLAKDRRIVLGKDELHIPIVGVFQFRPWNIPFEDIVSIEEQRKAGGSSKVVIQLRNARPRRFAASVLSGERGNVIKAIERRATAE